MREAKLRLVDEGRESGSPSPPSDPPSGNLPVELSSFVGRKRELAEISELMVAHRLTALIGAGGCGKTRLAIRAASEGAEGFADGAWWVDLAPVSDPDLVAATITEAIGVRPLPGVNHLDAAAAYLGDKSVLIVLDNCEHLIEATAAAAEALLQAGPGIAILATSRAPLKARGEIDWRVPSLSLGEPDVPSPESFAESDAALLFLERASEVDPRLKLNPATDESIERICSHLDGMPLAIELAAARLRTLSPRDIAVGLAERFRTLGEGPRTEMPRLRTLRASVDWSYELLSEDQRTLLRRVAVFAGGLRLSDAKDVCSDDRLPRDEILALLASLVDQSLVDVVDSGDERRYRLLETVRDYGLERLAGAGEEAVVRARHLHAFLALAEEVKPQLESKQQVKGLKLLDPDAGNLAAAIEYAIGSDPAAALRLCIAIHRWWAIRGRYLEAERAFARSLEAASASDRGLRAAAHEARAYVKVWTAEYAQAAADATEALALARDEDSSTAARARCDLAIATQYTDPAAARAEAKRAAALAARSEDGWALVTANQLIANAHFFESHHREAMQSLIEVADLAEEVGDPFLTARGWLYRGLMAATDGRVEETRDAADSVLHTLGETRDPVLEAYADFLIGWMDVHQGEPDRALERLEARLQVTLKNGGALPLPVIFYGIALADLGAGRPERIPERIEPLVALIKGIDDYGTAMNLGVLGEARRLRGEGGAREAVTEGLELAQRIGNPMFTGISHQFLGRIEAAGGNWNAARKQAQTHLDLMAAGGHDLFVPSGLDGLAEAAAGNDDDREAVRLFGAADRARSELGTVRVPPERQHWTAIYERLRSGLGEARYEAARAQGARLSLREALEWTRRGRGNRQRPAGGWESLTPTEARVAELVADGLTNPMIAEHMFVSAGTVKTHVSHIFKKLDIRSRAELATLAARRASADDA